MPNYYHQFNTHLIIHFIPLLQFFTSQWIWSLLVPKQRSVGCQRRRLPGQLWRVHDWTQGLPRVDDGISRRDRIPGLPLHYYLARSANIDMDTIVMLVNAYPKSLTAMLLIGCGDILRPIDMLLREKSLGFPAIRSYCETQYLTLEGIRERINQIPTDLFNDMLEHYNFLHFVCQNECVTLEVVEYLLSDEYDPNAASRTIDARAHFDSTAYALHYACANKDCPNSQEESFCLEPRMYCAFA